MTTRIGLLMLLAGLLTAPSLASSPPTPPSTGPTVKLEPGTSQLDPASITPQAIIDWSNKKRIEGGGKDFVRNLWPCHKETLLPLLDEMLGDFNTVETGPALDFMVETKDPFFKDRLISFCNDQVSREDGNLHTVLYGLAQIGRDTDDDEIALYLESLAAKCKPHGSLGRVISALSVADGKRALEFITENILPAEDDLDWVDAQSVTRVILENCKPAEAIPMLMTRKMLRPDFQTTIVGNGIVREYGPSALPALKEFLKNDHNEEPAYIRFTAQKAHDELLIVAHVQELESAKDEPGLIADLQSQDWMLRRYAVLALGRIGSIKALKPVEDLFDDPYMHKSGSGMFSYRVREAAWISYKLLAEKHGISVDLKKEPVYAGEW